MKSLDLESQAHHEEATDELARLDECCSTAPPSIPRALWLRAVAELSSPDPLDLAPLVAADGDVFHEASLPAVVLGWRTLLAAEERRTRGGAFLSATRLEPFAPTLASYAERGRLEAVWRESGRSRPVLIRALDSSAWFPSGADGAEASLPDRRAARAAIASADAGSAPDAVATGPGPVAGPDEAIAALLLCAGGRTDRVRVLPFVNVAPDVRRDAIRAWRDGDEAPWARAALGATAHRARLLREAVRRATDAIAGEEEVVAAMGRAGITARRALATVRTLLAVSMPVLAEELGLSRPAAAAALERLEEAGLIREVTGRSRDRVHAYGAAMSVAESRLAS